VLPSPAAAGEQPRGQAVPACTPVVDSLLAVLCQQQVMCKCYYAGEELDVRALHATVQAHGGYDAVTKGRLWARIAGGLAIPLDYQNAGTVLRHECGSALCSVLWQCQPLRCEQHTLRGHAQ
jgi:ARID/BRIGHT DNA binding domain